MSGWEKLIQFTGVFDLSASEVPIPSQLPDSVH